MTINYTHPIFDTLNHRIDTPASDQLKKTIDRWLVTGASGGFIYGRSRVGKTRAIRWLSSQLQTLDGKSIPARFTSFTEHDNSSVASVYRQLCFSQGLKVSTRDNFDTLFGTYFHYLLDLASAAEIHHVVQFIDEMQELSARQIKTFCHLNNWLEEAGILLTVIFIGNEPSCWELLKLIYGGDYGPTYGRFFTQGSEFLGIKTKNDLKKCLKQYDILRDPADRQTYVQSFIPEYDNQKWKIESITDDLWKTYIVYKKKFKLKSWPMKYFVEMIRILLRDYIAVHGLTGLNPGVYRGCIKASGLIPSLVVPIHK